MNEVDVMKREAMLSRAWAMAREMGAQVQFMDFSTGLFVMRILPSALTLFDKADFPILVEGE